MLIEYEMDNRCDAVFVVVLDKIGNDKQSKDIGNNSRRLTNRQSFLKWIIRNTRQSKLCKTETRKFVCMDLLQIMKQTIYHLKI